MPTTITHKKCSDCKQTLPISEFTKNPSKSDGFQTTCKNCKKIYNAAYYRVNKHRYNIYTPAKAARRKILAQKTKQFVLDYLKTHPCVDCGEPDTIVLQFDHQGNKIASISQMITWGSSIKRIQNEIKKCEVVCANCHTRRTAVQFNWWRAQPSVLGEDIA
jgi:hypothetical protein